MFRRLRAFSLQDARLTLQFLPLVIGVRWKLWRAPFPRLQQGWQKQVQWELDKATAFIKKPPTPFALTQLDQEQALKKEVWQCAHAVARAARLVPRASCLTQAMTLQFVLAQRGQTCQIYIGVAHNKGKDSQKLVANSTTTTFASSTLPPKFQAHAWVEWNDKVVLGGDVSRWQRLTVFASTPTSSEADTVKEGISEAV